MGKKKIEIKKISEPKSLKVTCCKRRQGLFRKAGVFCSRSGAQIAIITFSPGEKPMTYGNPSVEEVIDRYERSLQSSNGNKILVEDGDLNEVGTSGHDQENEMLERMGLNELKRAYCRVEEQRNKLVWRIEDRRRRESSTQELLGMNNASEELKLSGKKVAENMDIEEMKRRESCTQDFLRNFN